MIQERKRSIFSEFDAKLDYHRDRDMPPDILLQSIPTDLAEVPGTVCNVGDLALTIETLLNGTVVLPVLEAAPPTVQ